MMGSCRFELGSQFVAPFFQAELAAAHEELPSWLTTCPMHARWDMEQTDSFWKSVFPAQDVPIFAVALSSTVEQSEAPHHDVRSICFRMFQ